MESMPGMINPELGDNLFLGRRTHTHTLSQEEITGQTKAAIAPRVQLGEPMSLIGVNNRNRNLKAAASLKSPPQHG